MALGLSRVVNLPNRKVMVYNADAARLIKECKTMKEAVTLTGVSAKAIGNYIKTKKRRRAENNMLGVTLAFR